MSLIALDELKYSTAAFAVMAILAWVGFAPIVQYISRKTGGHCKDCLEAIAYGLVLVVLYIGVLRLVPAVFADGGWLSLCHRALCVACSCRRRCNAQDGQDGIR